MQRYKQPKLKKIVIAVRLGLRTQYDKEDKVNENSCKTSKV